MKNRVLRIIRFALSATSSPKHGEYSASEWDSDRCYLSKSGWNDTAVVTHKLIQKSDAYCGVSTREEQLFQRVWESFNFIKFIREVLRSLLLHCLTWANMRLSCNPANLNLEKNSKKATEKVESVASSLFYYLVSLWRNPQIASTDPSFTAACHPGNL